jgi:hypothetical protein
MNWLSEEGISDGTLLERCSGAIFTSVDLVTGIKLAAHLMNATLAFRVSAAAGQTHRSPHQEGEAASAYINLLSAAVVGFCRCRRGRPPKGVGAPHQPGVLTTSRHPSSPEANLPLCERCLPEEMKAAIALL